MKTGVSGKSPTPSINPNGTVKKYTVVYPWGEWFKKARKKTGVELRKGKEFDCKSHSMIYMIRDAARRHGIRVQIVLGDDDTTLHVKYKEDRADAAAK